MNRLELEGDGCIRMATTEDAASLAAIYAPYVTDTPITFETDIPDAAEFAARIAGVLRTHPFLVLEESGEIIGYAYAHPFGARAAYTWSAETSIYLRQDKRGGGRGSNLLAALEAVLAAQGVNSAVAVITAPADAGDKESPSMGFHRARGYALAGRYERAGYKLGAWHDIVWMIKHLGESKVPPPLLPPAEALARIL